MNRLYSFVILSICLLQASLCLSQDITLTTQAEVVAFDQSITNITGDLNIIGTGSPDPITDLADLTNLTTVGGNLYIYDNTAMTNLDGLSSLTSVGGGLRLEYNYILTNVDGLNNLATSGGNVYLGNNASLTNLDGLSSLTSLGGDLELNTNILLSNVNGLSNLTSIVGSLVIRNNDVLTHLDGLLGVVSIGWNLSITYNNELSNLYGLTNVTSVIGFLTITNNDVLTHLDGLSNLSSLGVDMEIRNNPILNDCCGIQDLLVTPGAMGGFAIINGNPSECSSPQEVIETSCSLDFDFGLSPPCINASNGSIYLTMKGFDTIPFSYMWIRQEDGATGSGSSASEFFSIDGLSTGTYNITVTNPLPDTAVYTGIYLDAAIGSIFEILEIESTNSSNGLSNGSIFIEITGGVPPYNFAWTGPSSGNDSGINASSYTFPSLFPGEYDLTITDDDGSQRQVSVFLLDETVPVFPCTQPLDIVVLNDVSGSVDAIEYEDSKRFFVDFLSHTNIGWGADESRAAIIEWSNRQDIRIPITGDMTTITSYLTAARASSAGTSPQQAMIFGKNFLDGVARPNVSKVLILSTDGTAGQITPSMVALADQFRAEGYHIITIAFDGAYESDPARETLRQIASIDLLAPGAPAYSLLDGDLAENIVNLYLCPIDPGSSATAYFNRDGAMDILDIQPVGNCPYPEQVEVTFTVEALREQSLPAGTPITFYHNNPALFGATSILTWLIPCALPAGSIETFTVTLPVSGPTNIFAVLNDNGSQSPPIQHPITDLEELAYSNNIDNQTVCTEGEATLQAFKQTHTPTPICDSTVIYTIDVCNISDIDAFDVVITDRAPLGFALTSSTINDNGCTSVNGSTYDIPAGCCVSLTLTYDAAGAAQGYYNDQDVGLSGPSNQIYFDFDGLLTTAEDVLIDGTIDCGSTIINFTKEVNTVEICDDAFVIYTFTIDNQLNVPLQGLSFNDVLPDPVTWAFEPYNLQGLRISNQSVAGNMADFIIDEVAANTVATFSMDANLGMWSGDGILTNSATLTGVPDLLNGGLQTLISNAVSTDVTVGAQVMLPDTLDVIVTGPSISLDAAVILADSIRWTTSGDGLFTSSATSMTDYIFGVNDLLNEEVSLFVSVYSECGESGHNILVLIEIPLCNLQMDQVDVGLCSDNGTSMDPLDDTYEVTLNISTLNPGVSNAYTINDGINNYGSFNYGLDEMITLPADGITYTLTIADLDDPACTIQTPVSQEPCSSACTMNIELEDVGSCNDNGTESDPSDDTYEVTLNITAINPGISSTYTINDGINNFGPFNYGADQMIMLPADGQIYNLIFTDVENADCMIMLEVSQNNCACNIDAYFQLQHPLCQDDLFGQIIMDSILGSATSYNYSLNGDEFRTLDLINQNNPAVINELIPGDYQIIIRESADTSCQQILAFTINEPFDFNINLGADTTIRLGESVDINPTADTDINDITWSWTASADSSDLSCDDCSDPTITPGQTGTYQVSATHINGCTTTDQITLTVLDDYNLYIPNAFTPNGDGLNDVFTIYPGLGIASIENFKIFGRWGEMIYDQSSSSGLTSIDQETGWDGTFLDEDMDTGVYIYYVEIELLNGGRLVLSGDVTLVR